MSPEELMRRVAWHPPLITMVGAMLAHPHMLPYQCTASPTIPATTST